MIGWWGVLLLIPTIDNGNFRILYRRAANYTFYVQTIR